MYNNKLTISEVYMHVKGEAEFDKFWKKLKATPGMEYQFGEWKLYHPEMLYEYFRKNGFEAYFERNKLKSWEEVIFFIEDRMNHYADKYGWNRPLSTN